MGTSKLMVIDLFSFQKITKIRGSNLNFCSRKFKPESELVTVSGISFNASGTLVYPRIQLESGFAVSQVKVDTNYSVRSGSNGNCT